MPTIAELEAQLAALRATAPPTVKLDLGCGTRKQEGHVGVDSRQFAGVDVVCDLGSAPWPWADNSVDAVHCSHMLEHLANKEVDWAFADGKLAKSIRYPRVHFFNELYRVMRPGAKALVVTPHWCSPRAYGDPTHEWAPVCEWTLAYLDKQWRATQAPHDDFYSCDFTSTHGYTPAEWLKKECENRNPEFVQKTLETALTKYKQAADDMVATLVARKP